MSFLPPPLDLGRIAGVLDELGAEIEALGAVLASDAELASAHSARLQAIDRIAQTQRAIAGLLRADCGVENLGLEKLRERLR